MFLEFNLIIKLIKSRKRVTDAFGNNWKTVIFTLLEIFYASVWTPQRKILIKKSFVSGGVVQFYYFFRLLVKKNRNITLQVCFFKINGLETFKFAL